LLKFLSGALAGICYRRSKFITFESTFPSPRFVVRQKLDGDGRPLTARASWRARRRSVWRVDQNSTALSGFNFSRADVRVNGTDRGIEGFSDFANYVRCKMIPGPDIGRQQTDDTLTELNDLTTKLQSRTSEAHGEA
jgi:hypothetical protein